MNIEACPQSILLCTISSQYEIADSIIYIQATAPKEHFFEQVAVV